MFTKRLFLSVVILVVFILQVGSAAAFDVAAGHSMQKIRRDGVGLNELEFNPRIELEVAIAESESFQLAVIPSGKSLKDMKVNTDPLRGEKGSLKLKWHRVEYVRTGNPSYKVKYVGWWPDPLMPAGAFDVAADKVQPLWFTVDVGADTAPGVYKGKVVIQAGSKKRSIPVTVRVRNFALPMPGTLAMPFGLYAPEISKWYFGDANYQKHISVETFSNWCELMGKYRLTPKNIGFEYIKRTINGKDVKGESASALYMKLVLDEEKRRGFNVDMSALQKTVGKLAEEYFAPYSYGLYRLPSAPSFHKKETSVGHSSDSVLPWDAAAVAGPVKAHAEEWKRQGFPEEVYIYGVDEPVGEKFQAFLKETYSLIKKDLPSVKIMQTIGRTAPQLIGLVDIWCPKTTAVRGSFYEERLKAGDTLWNYICVSPIPPAANFFIDEAAIDHRILFWQTKKVNATGLLYWSTTWYNFMTSPASGEPAFPDVPMDIRQQELFTHNWVHVNGDGLLIYPGKNLTPLPSIRMEVIRDGIEDFEYITLLEKLVEKVKQIDKYQKPGGKTVVVQAEKLCKVPDIISSGLEEFTKDPHVIFERRKAIGDMIEQLTDILENKDYTLWK